jgi:2',3'-cyclic-nucleotide 2'-phosphodiesterase (5'-nucleotidase family)
VKEIRGSSKGVVLLDAGDLLFRKSSGLLSENESKTAGEKALLIIECFNLMGYDAIGIGDDDLNLGREFLVEASKKASFPFLSSNVVDEESGKPLFRSHLLKEVNDLKIGIFSLLSADLFGAQGDLRRKGLMIRDPIETAQSMVKELQPRTDLIILLSHLGYTKDFELAKVVPGIHFIVGGHTGINFTHPTLINHTVVLQTGAKGMQAGRLDLTLYNRDPFIHNAVTRRSLENNLSSLNALLRSQKATEAERAQWAKAKQAVEGNLKQLKGKNDFTNTILPLSEHMKDHPEIAKIVEAFRSKYPEAGKP